MPSNQTPNYRLSQWERTDKVLMDDFNADNAKIDAALKAEADARTALAETVSRQGSTLSGHTASLAKVGSCQVYTTSYTGTGSKARSYSFPAYPVLVYVRETGSPTGYTFFRGMNCATSQEYSASWSGHTLSLRTPDNNNFGININGYKFFVFALLDMSK